MEYVKGDDVPMELGVSHRSAVSGDLQGSQK